MPGYTGNASSPSSPVEVAAQDVPRDIPRDSVYTPGADIVSDAELIAGLAPGLLEPIIAPATSWDLDNVCGKGRLVTWKPTGTYGCPIACEAWNCIETHCGRRKVGLVLRHFAVYFVLAAPVFEHRVPGADRGLVHNLQRAAERVSTPGSPVPVLTVATRARGPLEKVLFSPARLTDHVRGATRTRVWVHRRKAPRALTMLQEALTIRRIASRRGAAPLTVNERQERWRLPPGLQRQDGGAQLVGKGADKLIHRASELASADVRKLTGEKIFVDLGDGPQPTPLGLSEKIWLSILQKAFQRAEKENRRSEAEKGGWGR